MNFGIRPDIYCMYCIYNMCSLCNQRHELYRHTIRPGSRAKKLGGG